MYDSDVVIGVHFVVIVVILPVMLPLILFTLLLILLEFGQVNTMSINSASDAQEG